MSKFEIPELPNDFFKPFIEGLEEIGNFDLLDEDAPKPKKQVPVEKKGCKSELIKS